MKIINIIKGNKPSLSFEVFPPKTFDSLESVRRVTEEIADAGIAANEIKVENGSCFCIGDNPDNSEDSRSANIGLVKEKDILGKAWFHAATSNMSMGFVK